MIDPHGPGEPFTTLFDEQEQIGWVLPDAFHHIYGPWPLPAPPDDRPFTYVNFVMSHDGRVSFNDPRMEGGGDISRRDPHDRWLMGLLRARADAVLVGGSSIAAAGNHVWTPAAVYPQEREAFAALREREGRALAPLLVVLTRSGQMPQHAPALDDPALPVLIATTDRGKDRARSILGAREWVSYVTTGETLDQHRVAWHLRNAGVRTLLAEGGPLVYASLLAADLIDDAFVTLSPIMVGETTEQRRPSLIEGVAFDVRHPPQLRLLSVHRHGSYLYMHSRYQRNEQP